MTVYRVEGIVALVGEDEGKFNVSSQDAQTIAKNNAKKKIPLMLEHDDDDDINNEKSNFILGYGKIKLRSDNALVFDGVIDCGHFLNLLEKSKNYYYYYSKPYVGEGGKKTMSDFLSVQFGQLSLAHEKKSFKIDHVGLTHLGQRAGSQANFTPSSEHGRVYRRENKKLASKVLALAFTQRHQVPFRKRKLFKDIRWNKKAEELIYAKFYPTTTTTTQQKKVTKMDPRDDIIKILLRHIPKNTVDCDQKEEEEEEENKNNHEDGSGPSLPKKSKKCEQQNDDVVVTNDNEEEEEAATSSSLESRLERIERLITTTAAAAEEGEEEEDEVNQEDSSKTEKEEKGKTENTNDTQNRLARLEAQIKTLTEEKQSKQRWLFPPPKKNNNSKARQKTVTRQPTTSKNNAAGFLSGKDASPVVSAALASRQNIIKKNGLIKAAFDPRNEASEIESIHMTELMPRNNPLAVRLTKNIEQDIQDMSAEDRQTLVYLMAEKSLY